MVELPILSGPHCSRVRIEGTIRGNQGRFSRVVFEWFWAWFWELVLVDFWSAKTKVLV